MTREQAEQQIQAWEALNIAPPAIDGPPTFLCYRILRDSIPVADYGWNDNGKGNWITITDPTRLLNENSQYRDLLQVSYDNTQGIKPSQQTKAHLHRAATASGVTKR